MQKCTSLVSSEKTSSKSTSNSEGGLLGHCASNPVPSTSQNRAKQTQSDVLMQLPASESVHLVNDEQRLIVWTIVVWSGASPVKSWRGVVGIKGREVHFRKYSRRTWRMCGAYCTQLRLRRKSVSNTCARAQGQPCQRRSLRPRDRSKHERSSGLVAAEKTSSWRHPPEGQPSRGAPPRQRRMPELKRRRNPAKKKRKTKKWKAKWCRI